MVGAVSCTILVGDARQRLRELPDGSVNCCVTSPPYFGLRDYGADGQIGLEQTPEEYVAALVDVFREVRRVLRDDGVLWLNLGDSYAGSGRGAWDADPERKAKVKEVYTPTRAESPTAGKNFGLKPKDLIGIPWMVAFALRSDGWYLRGDHPWGKPNGMPESVLDRPTRGHEYFFLLTKSPRYWYDAAAVRTAPKASTITRLAQNIDAQAGSTRANGGKKSNGPMKAVKPASSTLQGGGHGRHAYGEALPESARRSDKQRGHTRRDAGFNDRWDAMERGEQMEGGSNLRSVWWIPPAQYGGSHYAVMPDLAAEICIRSGCPVGGTVLDIFGGVGTTGLVAERLGRNAVLIELNPTFAEEARARIRAGLGTVQCDMPERHNDAGPLFGDAA